MEIQGWPQACGECGEARSAALDEKHLRCMSHSELDHYVEFWSASVKEEERRIAALREDELSRRRAAYALWIADRRLSAGKREARQRSVYKPE